MSLLQLIFLSFSSSFIVCYLPNHNVGISPPELVGGSPGDVSEEPVPQEKRKKGWKMSCDIGEATEGLEN